MPVTRPEPIEVFGLDLTLAQAELLPHYFSTERVKTISVEREWGRLLVDDLFIIGHAHLLPEMERRNIVQMDREQVAHLISLYQDKDDVWSLGYLNGVLIAWLTNRDGAYVRLRNDRQDK